MGSINATCNTCNELDYERKMTNKIEKGMAVSKKDTSDIVKLLLLGSESSDTSRILRQIQYQHNMISTNTKHTNYIISIRKFAVSSILRIYSKSQFLYKYNPVNYAKFNLDHLDSNLIKLLESALNKFNNNSWLKNHIYLSQIAECINILWSLDAIQSTWELVYSSNKNIKYYMDKIDDIMDCNNYIPTYNDIMLLPYSNISEISLSFQQTAINIVTMNGSKYNKKWLHSFDHVSGIIFVVSLNDFDQILRKNKINALLYSLDLFEKIVNDKVFTNTPIMLIFDQFDLFQEKINNGSSISTLFNQYIEHNDIHQNIENSLNFIKKAFLDRVNNKNKKRGIYIHCTSFYGNNFNQIHKLFKDVQHIKVTKNLDIGGLL